MWQERLKLFKTSVCGMLVGAADIVPGISGGTVAFIIGIYEELLGSIATINATALKRLMKLDFRGFFSQVAWKFLLFFVLGVAISFLSLAKGFHILLNNESLRPLLYSVFMGLVVGSTFFCAKLLGKFSVKSLTLLLCGAIFAFMLSGTEIHPQQDQVTYNVPLLHPIEVTKPLTNYADGTLFNVPESHLQVLVSKKEIHEDTKITNCQTGATLAVNEVIQGKERSFLDFWVIVCGMLAISAMLLPGISGSYLLNVLGMYGIVLGALVDWVEALKMGHFDTGAFRIVASMGIGIILGACLFARVVNFLFRRYPEATLSLLVGFMIGALRSVWPFWTCSYQLSALNLSSGPLLQVGQPILPDLSTWLFFFSALSFITGVAAVLFIEHVASKKRTECVYDQHPA